MKFNTPTKLTMLRIILAFVIVFLLIFPFYRVGITFPTFLYNNILIDLKYIIAGIIFVFAAVTDFFDGMLARKNNDITLFGKFVDTIADKILVDSVLIVFAAYGYIPVLIPVIIVIRDILIDAMRMHLGTKGKVQAAKISGKLKTATLMIGIALTFFYNLPFEIWNLEISTAFLYFGTVMAVISLFDYYYSNKKIIFATDNK